jgi:hypothetical protein
MSKTTTIARAVALSAAFGAGCVSGSPLEQDPGHVDISGGSMYLSHCGHDLITRDGVTAPEMGQPLLGDDPRPRHVHLGFPGDPATTMGVLWRTHDETTLATTVQYGVGDALDQEQEGATYRYYTGIGGAGELIRIHEVHLCGLLSDTDYSYRVGGVGTGGQQAWSPVYTFRTAPAPSQRDAEIVVAVLGDTRDGFDVWGRLLDLVADHGPDLILFSGDATTIGSIQLEWEPFFDVGERVLANVPIISAHGNHDLNAANYYQQFVMPGDEENFGFDYGPLHVTVLNDSPLVQADLFGRIPEFLAADLAAAADAPWKIVMHHRPMWSASTRHGGDESLQDSWGPIIDAHRVDLVIAGHDHNYERTRPLRNKVVQGSPAEGTVYVVAGGAGANLYPNGSEYWTEISESTYNMMIMRISAEMLEMRAYRDNGSLLDSMTITKTGQ